MVFVKMASQFLRDLVFDITRSKINFADVPAAYKLCQTSYHSHNCESLETFRRFESVLRQKHLPFDVYSVAQLDHLSPCSFVMFFIMASSCGLVINF